MKKEEKDIREIQIAKIADEFVAYVKQMQKFDVAVASEFMVMAATLMVLKSKALLATDEKAQEEVKDEREKLVQRIEEYEKVKEVVSFLEEKSEAADKLYRVKVKKTGQARKRENEAFPEQLFLNFKNAYNELKMREKVYKVSGEQYSISGRIKYLKELLLAEKRMPIEEIFGTANDRIDLIVSFLGILELIKLSFLYIEYTDQTMVCLVE
ncbi:MAG TPA: segregation/condensation protein A [Thermotogota bacterium]|nr:segregation/condensation protein A [Thermotogota bacterium]HPJ88222.1 segregation/condensation protein A [Thermotogota bacterium]HPR96071.1 segregation/condensation protein A [Thermotogota bacterium]